jgi:small multidrug resistance pump
MMAWLYLACAIAFEVGGTISMKLSEGFTRTLPSVMIFVCYAIAFTFVTFAIKKIEISVAYTVWAGVGTAAIAIIGMLYFKESANLLKILSIGVIILGVIGLKLSGGNSQ